MAPNPPNPRRPADARSRARATLNASPPDQDDFMDNVRQRAQASRIRREVFEELAGAQDQRHQHLERELSELRAQVSKTSAELTEQDAETRGVVEWLYGEQHDLEVKVAAQEAAVKNVVGAVKVLEDRLDSEVRGGGGLLPTEGDSLVGSGATAAAAAASKRKTRHVFPAAKVRVVPKQGAKGAAQAKKQLSQEDEEMSDDYEFGPVLSSFSTSPNTATKTSTANTTTANRPKKVPQSRLPPITQARGPRERPFVCAARPRSVASVWKEWKTGLHGNLPLAHLEKTYGRKYVKSRKLIVEYVEETARALGVSSMKAIAMLDARVDGRMDKLEDMLLKGQDPFIDMKRRG